MALELDKGDQNEVKAVKHDSSGQHCNPLACFCVFILSPVREGSNLYGDHRGSIFSNRAETSQEG